MKKITLTLIWLAVSVALFSQQVSHDSTQKISYYIEKGKSQSSTGLALLIGGGAAVVIGIVWSVADYNSSDFGSDNSAAGIVWLGGTLAMLTSIPFFISSHNNIKKAMSLSATVGVQEKTGIIASYEGKYYPALSLKIGF